MEDLAAFSKLHLFAHEYLDLRYPSVEQFVLRGPPLCYRLAEVTSHFAARARDASP